MEDDGYLSEPAERVTTGHSKKKTYVQTKTTHL